MAAFNTILFDLGSTLIYFDADWEVVMQESVQVLHRKLRKMGFELDESFPAVYRAIAREFYRWREEDLVETPAPVVLRKVMAEFGIYDMTDGQVEDALADLFAVSQAHWNAEEDAVPTLRTLCAAGYKIGLVSNAGYDADIQMLIDKARLRPFLGFIISSAACGMRKPHPRIFQQALDALGSQASQAVMVGDFLEADILGANNLGMGSVWIKRRVDPVAALPILERIRPARTITALAELPGVLESWRTQAS